MMGRAAAISQPGWRSRCRGLLAAAATSTEELPTGPASRRDGRMFAPGVEPVLVLLLLVESACVACWEADGGVGVGAALNLLQMPLQDATPHNLDPLTVRDVLQHLWLGMGQTLLAATGSAAAELQDEQEPRQGEQTAGSSSSSQQGQQQGRRVYGLVDGGGASRDVAAGTAQQTRYMWSRFSTTLFRTFTWMDDVYHTVRPTEMFREQPDLASCVLEAAFRASREDNIDFYQRDKQAHSKVLFGMQLAVANCLPEQLPAAAHEGLCTKLSSASRHCSLLVSAMKEVEGRAALPGFDPAMMPYLSSMTSMAASAAPIFAFADQLQQQTATPASLPYLAGPANTAWLFAVGRALVTAGRVLQLVPVWRAHPAKHSPPSSLLLLQLMGFVQPLRRIQHLLSAMLDQLEQGQPAPPAAATVPSTPFSPPAIEDVLKGSRMILQAYQPLIDQSTHTAMHGMLAAGHSSRQQLNAAFDALTAACAQGGLPTLLQAVGASLCAAFPQRFACNNPTCGSMEGLTEAACAVKKCSGCQVARYCCREHQLSHWPAHKKVCKHLQKLAAAPAGAAGATTAAT